MSTTNFYKDKNLEPKTQLRRIESASSLNKKIEFDPGQMEHKYRLLEQNYKRLLCEAQTKT